MELQVQELLDRIKSEGIETARAEAEKLVVQARKEAEAIVETAERKAKAAAMAAADRIKSQEEASRLALVQASRDTLLALRERISAFLRGAMQPDSASALDASGIAGVLPEILKAAASGASGDIAVLLPSKTLEAMDASIAARISAELRKGVEFKPFNGIDAGFRVGFKDSSAQLDFSLETVAAVLASRVNARLAECIAEAGTESGTP